MMEERPDVEDEREQKEEVVVEQGKRVAFQLAGRVRSPEDN